MVKLYYVAVGSNLGDRLEYLRQGVRGLEKFAKAKHFRKSPIYETDPLGGPQNQGSYLNAVVSFESPLEPGDLLKMMLELERAQGRVRTVPNAPRTLDLDLLLAGQDVLDWPKLQIPHPRLPLRAFVLVPLADLDPNLQIPGAGAVRDLLKNLYLGGVHPTELAW